MQRLLDISKMESSNNPNDSSNSNGGSDGDSNGGSNGASNSNGNLGSGSQSNGRSTDTSSEVPTPGSGGNQNSNAETTSHSSGDSSNSGLQAAEQGNNSRMLELQLQVQHVNEELDSLTYILLALREGTEHEARVLLDHIRASNDVDIRALANTLRTRDLAEGRVVRR